MKLYFGSHCFQSDELCFQLFLLCKFIEVIVTIFSFNPFLKFVIVPLKDRNPRLFFISCVVLDLYRVSGDFLSVFVCVQL